jgi:hypothetical protein
LVSRVSRCAARRRCRFSLGHASYRPCVAGRIRATRAPKYPAPPWGRLVDASGGGLHGHRSVRREQRRLTHRPSLRSQRSCIALRRRHGFARVDLPARTPGAQPVAGNRPHFRWHRLRKHLKPPLAFNCAPAAEVPALAFICHSERSEETAFSPRTLEAQPTAQNRPRYLGHRSRKCLRDSASVFICHSKRSEESALRGMARTIVCAGILNRASRKDSRAT